MTESMARGRRWVNLVYLLFLLSGLTSLIYQVIWVREFGLVFGVTTYATSTVLAAFFAGLALGSYIAGRTIDRTRFHPLAVYGLMEGAIAVYALFLPLFLNLVEATYPGVYASLGESFSLFTLYRFLACFAFLVIPTTLMGATLPVLSKLMVSQENILGLNVGRLYAVNTFGAVGGTFAAGFILIPMLGVTNTIMVAAVGNFLLAVIALLLSRLPSFALAHTPDAAPAASAEGSALALPAEEPAPADPTDILVLLLAFTSGLAVLALEVIWTKSLVLVLGSTTYAFSTMLTAVLVGIALGSSVFAHRADGCRNRAALVGFLIFGGGFCAALGPAIIDWLPFIFLRLADWTRGNWYLYIGAQFIICFALVFIPTFLSGAAFPILVRMHSRGIGRVGRTVADVYSVNTLGGILGSLLGGFVLIRFLGLESSLITASLFLMAVGGPVAIAIARPWGKLTRLSVATCMMLVVVAFAFFHPRLDIKLLFGGWGPFGGGYTSSRSGQTTVDVTDRHMQRLLYHQEGVSAAVDVLETAWGRRLISINAQPVATTYLYDMRALRMLGHLPVLLHPNPKEALLIGLGAGISSGIIATYPSIDRVTVVELNEEVPDGARWFADWNFNAVDHPKVNIVINDGANYVKATRKQYDIISSDPIHPFILGNGTLYSADHWRICRDRLRPGGVLAQWIPLYQLSATDFGSIVHTFLEVFPNATMWYCGIDVVLIGVNGDAKIDLQAMARHMSDPVIMRDLLSMGVHGTGDVLGWLVGGPAELQTMAAGTPVNSIERPVLEYTAPKALSLYGTSATMPLIMSAVEQHLGADARPRMAAMCVQKIDGQTALSAATTRLAGRWIMRSQLLSSYDYAERAADACRRALSLRPQDNFLRQALSEALAALADAQLNDGDLSYAYDTSTEAFLNDPDNLYALTGAVFAALQQGDIDLAENTLNWASPEQRKAFQCLVYSGLISLRRFDYKAARKAFQEAAAGGQESPTMRIGLGVVELHEGDTKSAHRRFDRALRISTVPIDALYDIVDMSLSHNVAGSIRKYAEELRVASSAAIASDPGRPPFYGYRALAHSALGNAASAQQDEATASTLRGWWAEPEVHGSELSYPAPLPE